MKYSTSIFLVSVLLYAFSVKAQHPTDTIPGLINTNNQGTDIKFSSELRPLRQIAGAPQPFYSYYWEFGDGSFSFDKEPVHAYPDSSMYNVRLYATNNYDDGPPPTTRPKPLKGLKGTAYGNKALAFFKTEKGAELKTNRMPRPGEEVVLIIGYRNKQEWNIPNLSGTVSVLFNEKQFKQDNFALGDIRTYNNEQKTMLNANMASVPVIDDWKQKGGSKGSVALTKEEVKAKTDLFRNSSSWRFKNVKQGEEKFMFMSLKTTPEMVKDTNAVVLISALFTPDDPAAETQIFDLELQIVASHDPNKMMLKNRNMNYRFTGKNRRLTYKVRFQNTGEGPAKKVAIGITRPPVLDVKTIKITNSKPLCVLCDSLVYAGQSCLDTVISQDSIHFLFKNIYLPGTKQKGVTDRDSTMGFVEYQIGFIKKPRKLPFYSQAAIVFDKNEPIYTNRSAAKFKPGISPGIIVMYGSQLGHSNTPAGKNNVTLGVSIAPYSPYRKYLQAELYLSSFKETETFTGSTAVRRDTVIDKIGYLITSRERYERKKVTTIDVVPLQLRYNLTSFAGVGAGALVSMSINTRRTLVRNTQLTELNATGTNTGSRTLTETASQPSTRFDEWNTALFADLQLGRVRVGPALGIRYLQYVSHSDKRLCAYLTWKF